MTFKCPTCGRPMDKLDKPDVLMAKVNGNLQVKLMTALVKAYETGRLLTMVDLIDEVYKDKPVASARHSLATVMGRMKDRLEGTGWTIISQHDVNLDAIGYRLTKAEENWNR